MKRDVRVMTWSEKYRAGEVYWRCAIREYRRATTVKTGRPFDKFVGYVRHEGEGRTYATRAEALAAAKAGRDAYLARMAPTMGQKAVAQ